MVGRVACSFRGQKNVVYCAVIKGRFSNPRILSGECCRISPERPPRPFGVDFFASGGPMRAFSTSHAAQGG